MSTYTTTRRNSIYSSSDEEEVQGKGKEKKEPSSHNSTTSAASAALSGSSSTGRSGETPSTNNLRFYPPSQQNFSFRAKNDTFGLWVSVISTLALGIICGFSIFCLYGAFPVVFLGGTTSALAIASFSGIATGISAFCAWIFYSAASPTQAIPQK